MLQRPGHGGCFSFHDSEIVKEAFKREKRAEKMWKMKYAEEVEKLHKENETNGKGYHSNSPIISRLSTSSDPEYRCIGWGVAPLSKRNLELERIRGGLQGDIPTVSTTTIGPSPFGRTKRLESDFYDMGGISCFGENGDDNGDSDSDDDTRSTLSAARSTISNARSIASRISSRSSVPLGGAKTPTPKSTYSSTFSKK